MKKKYIVFTIFLIVIAALCGYYFLKEYQMAQDEAAYYQGLKDEHTITVIDDEEPDNAAGAPTYDELSGLAYVDIDFPALLAQNPETVGYIHIPDSSISFPVLQAQSNTKYLGTAFDGTKKRSGACFADKSNDIETDQNLIIYAHNMGNGRTGEMFGSLIFFKDAAYFTSHKYIQFNRAQDEGPQWWRVFAVIPHKLDNQEFNYLKLNFSDQDEFMNWIAKVQELSLFDSDAEIKANDRIITLSTCDKTIGKNARLLVLAVKLN